MLILTTILLCCFVAAKATLSGQFAVTTTVQLGEAAVADAILQLHSTLDVTYLNADDENPLLNFQLSSVEVRGRGAGAGAELRRRRAEGGGGPFVARLAGRALAELLLDPAEPEHLLNYKRALVSLFQFQLQAGEYNETDVSGACEVHYEAPAADLIRKFKRSCSWEGSAARGVSCRRVTRVALAGGALSEVHADEVCAAAGLAGGAGGGGGGGLRARSLLALRRVAPAAARAAPRAPAPQLRPAPLPLPAAAAPPRDDPALRDAAAAWARREEPARALQLYYALRQANASAVADLLHSSGAEAQDATGLWYWAGVAGTRAAFGVARAALAAHGDAAPAHAAAYLRGLLLAPKPHEEVVLEVLKLSEKLPAAGLAEAARLAAAAGAGRGAARGAVRAALRRALAACREPACRELQLRALYNAGVQDAALALAEAERGDERAARAALQLLGGAAEDDGAAGARLRGRLARLAGTASRPLAVRARAVQLAARGALAAQPTRWLELARLVRTLAARGRGSGELRRVLWAVLDGSGQRAKLLELLPRNLVSWDLLAAAGTSSVLERLAWRDVARAGRDARLASTSLAARGVLRSGDVALWAGAHHVLGVHVWTRGLHAWAPGAGGAGAGGGGGGEGDGLDDDEEAAAGIALSVAGRALPHIELFSSQAELLSLVWGGAGSDATPVLRAAVLLPRGEGGGAGGEEGGGGGAAPLAAGVLLHSEHDAAALLQLDGQAQVSLWGRTARALLELRGALAARAELRTDSGWGALRATAGAAAAPALDIAADLDFYGDVALCVRAAAAAHDDTRTVRTRAAVGRATRRHHAARTPRAARTLALGRPNDQLCRAA